MNTFSGVYMMNNRRSVKYWSWVSAFSFSLLFWGALIRIGLF
ncbi:small membrane protein YmiC [Phytobacter ursingii]|uniref:Small membrane protein YmiC n=1 Tax=Phytobacter ursingii TaxID=1972431 RepID=A0AB35RPZ0_9ENTR|nr:MULTISPECIES: small membrane protein YmiC [Enterobacteriaceae]MDV2863676.1 small membrane protein YmiC [Phytobacter ursingii]